MHKRYFLGVDIGTSSTKVILADIEGKPIGAVSQGYKIQVAKPGWAEQDPQDWINAVQVCVKDLIGRYEINSSSIDGIGLSGQMHTLVCLDDELEPLRPAILWADQRSGQIVSDLLEKYSLSSWGEWIGNPLAAGFSLPSWIWIQQNEPELAQTTRFLMQPKDFVRLWLTGEIATDPSDASASGFFNPHVSNWSESVIQIANLNQEQLPPILPSLAVAGYLTETAAKSLGLMRGVPVITGGGDQAMQAFGQGVIHEHQLSCTIGTGGQLFAPISSPIHDPGLRVHLFNHILPKVWHLQAATLSAGLSLDWFRNIFQDPGQFADLMDQAAKVSAAEEGLFFLPYLNGERTPWMDANARGAWIGLKYHHGKAHLTRAILEGVVFSLRQGLEILLDLGIKPDRVISSGGATRHALWSQLQAKIFNLPVITRDIPDASAWGAAMAAAFGIGEIPEIASVNWDRALSVKETEFLPEHDSLNYQACYQRYIQFYPALKPLMSD